MFRFTILLTFLTSASLAFAQLDSNSVTVTASRNTNLLPDQVVFGVLVDSGLNSSLDDILAALHGSGITAANFLGVSSAPATVIFSGPIPGPIPVTETPMLQWSFSLAVPFSKMKDTAAALTSLQRTISQQNNSGLRLVFQVQGAQISPQLQQSQTCLLTDLIADARSQAQKLGDAAGLSVGSILAVSSFTTTTTPGPIPVNRFSSTSGTFLPGCSVTVKFALGRF